MRVELTGPCQFNTQCVGKAHCGSSPVPPATYDRDPYITACATRARIAQPRPNRRKPRQSIVHSQESTAVSACRVLRRQSHCCEVCRRASMRRGCPYLSTVDHRLSSEKIFGSRLTPPPAAHFVLVRVIVIGAADPGTITSTASLSASATRLRCTLTPALSRAERMRGRGSRQRNCLLKSRSGVFD